MSDMVRKQIYITRRQEMLLKRLARLRGVSEAEIIRKALDREAEKIQLSSESSSHTAWEEMERLIEERRSLGITGEPYRFNREEIYAERENRWIRDRSDDTKPETE